MIEKKICLFLENKKNNKKNKKHISYFAYIVSACSDVKVHLMFFVSLQVIGARHLMKSGRGYVSPFVEIEIVGLDCDCNKFKTVTLRKSVL